MWNFLYLAILAFTSALNLVAVAQAQRMDPAVARDYNICDGTSHTPEETIAACTRAIDSRRLDRESLAATYNNRGYEYARKGDFALAVDSYDEALELMPAYFNALANRSVAYLAMKELDLAIVDAEYAMKVDSNYLASYATRARVLAAMGLPQQGMKDAELVIRQARQEADGYLARGDVFFAMGRLDEAVADYKRGMTLKADPYVKRALQQALTRVDETKKSSRNDPPIYLPQGSGK